jgi:hypothetical protein
VAEIVPPSPSARPKSRLGTMAGTILYMGDVISPVFDKDDFEALR